ncbi:MAG: alginate export family protein [Candidatus Hydrogenedentes bacterium]|nr:alginate export family protein [Candidatus Hydrogenedentota bacterium]
MCKPIIFVLVLALVGAAQAELQSVEVGGSIRVRGRYWRNTYANGGGGPQVNRIPGLFPGRALGQFGYQTRFDFDNRGNDLHLVEQKTRIGVTAHFTSEVSAHVTLESFDLWGEDFRSNYLTGVDTRAVSTNDVEVLYSYIRVEDLLGTPLNLQLGRQDLKQGKGWLVSDLISACLSLSFDAARLQYVSDDFLIDGWWAKLAENGALEEDGDVDFYGVYGTYRGIPDFSLSGYWLYIRDARALNDTQLGLAGEWAEELFGVDQYDGTRLHTIGARLAGQRGGWDLDIEAAYQFGDAGHAGAGFKQWFYGDDSARYDAWGGDLEVGYTLPITWTPRLFLGGAYFSGEDERDVSVLDWLNPFRTGPGNGDFWEGFSFWGRPKASVSFNRLFSGTVYSWIFDVGQDTSNFHTVRGGIEVHPSDAVTGFLQVAYFGANATTSLSPWVTIAGQRVALAPELSFWAKESDDYLGTSIFAWVNYAYSKDVNIRAGVEHLFVGDGLAEGNFINRNGFEFTGGSDDDDAQYFFVDLRTDF